jgi:hypothetical protein
MVLLVIRISRGLEQFQSLSLAKSAQVTTIRKDDWSRAEYCIENGARKHEEIPI